MIDGFSRFVVDGHVGISNRTQVACQSHYLHAVRKYGFPKLIRADKGTETTLIATCHVGLRREKNGPGLLFKEAFHYGPSTRNIRIEAWWNMLLKGLTSGWRAYFSQLYNDGDFNGSEIDKIALRFLYMDVLRIQLTRFIRMHNNHPIRKQKNRPYLPHGQPDEMFNYPPEGTRNYASIPQGPLFKVLEEQVAGFDRDVFQHPDTEALCCSILEAEGLLRPTTFSFKPGMMQPHTQMYRILRQKLYEYEESGGEVKAMLPPRGARKWIDYMAELEAERRLQEDLAGLPEIDLSGAESTSEEEIGDSDDRGDGFELDVSDPSIRRYSDSEDDDDDGSFFL
jgi:hypothetical protein